MGRAGGQPRPRTLIIIFGWRGSMAGRRETPIRWRLPDLRARPRMNLSAQCNWIRRMSRPASIWRSTTPRRRCSWAADWTRPASRRRRSQIRSGRGALDPGADRRQGKTIRRSGNSWQASRRRRILPTYWLQLADFYRLRGRLDDMQKAVLTAMAQPSRLPKPTSTRPVNCTWAGATFPCGAVSAEVSRFRRTGGGCAGLPRPLPAGPDLREDGPGRPRPRNTRPPFLWPRALTAPGKPLAVQ